MKNKRNAKWTLDALNRLDNLFDTEEKWTKGAWARDRDGDKVDSRSEKAYSFCFRGGIDHITRSPTVRNELLYTVRKFLDGQIITTIWNDDDSRTFADIKEVIGKAKAKVQEYLAAE